MKFTIYPQNVKTNVSELNGIAGELKNIYSGIESVINNNSIQLDSYVRVKRALKDYQRNVLTLSKNASCMSDGLQKAVSEYETHEQTICENASHGGPAGIMGGKSKDVDWSSVLWKFVGEAGVVGKTVSAGYKFLTGDKTSRATWAGAIKDGWGIGWDVGDVVKTCRKDPSVSWAREIFGFNNKPIENLGLSGTFSKAIDDLRGSAGRAKQVKSIGGIVLSAAMNGISNYEEYQNGEISVGRAVAETVMETAVDWGKNLLIGLGVAAGLTLVGVTSAPAAVIGVATVAVSVGVDWLSQKITGKKFTEAVSDAYLDFEEWKMDKIKTGAKKVKEGACALWNSIAGGWNAKTGNASVSYAW